MVVPTSLCSFYAPFLLHLLDRCRSVTVCHACSLPCLTVKRCNTNQQGTTANCCLRIGLNSSLSGFTRSATTLKVKSGTKPESHTLRGGLKHKQQLHVNSHLLAQADGSPCAVLHTYSCKVSSAPALSQTVTPWLSQSYQTTNTSPDASRFRLTLQTWPRCFSAW